MDAQSTLLQADNRDAKEVLGKQGRLTHLTDSAVELFSRYGFEGTSLRDIAAHAKVPLSMINRYFGSKLDLFNEIQHHVWKQVNIDRETLLRQSILSSGGGNPTLEAVLHAVIHPVVVRAIGDKAHAPMIRLLRENTSMRVHMGLKRGPSALRAEQWFKTLMNACPRLKEGEAVWALSFVIATMYCGQLLDGWLDDLMPPSGPRSADQVSKLMVGFCNAGIRAISQEQ